LGDNLSYSPDLIFEEKLFSSDMDIQADVLSRIGWNDKIPISAWQEYHTLPANWNKCMELKGEYVER